MANLRRVEQAAKARQEAEERFRAADERWREEMRAAYASGNFTLKQIAEAAGVVTQRVFQVVHRTR